MSSQKPHQYTLEPALANGRRVVLCFGNRGKPHKEGVDMTAMPQGISLQPSRAGIRRVRRATLAAAALVTLWMSTALGQAPPHAWSYGFGSAVGDYGYGIATDALGNAYVTGYFANTVNFGGGDLTSAGGGDIYLIKYNPNGGHVWSKRIGSTGTDEGQSIIVDGSGNVLVTGVFSNTVDFGGGGITSAGSRDIFVACFDANGNHIWSQGFGGSSTDQGYAIELDGSNNVLVTGFFLGTVNFGGGNLIDAGGGDVFLAKFTPNGAHVWSQRFGGTAADIGRGLATDGSDNVFLIGSSEGSADFGGGVLSGLGANDIYLAKYNSAGAHQWSQRFGNIQQQFGYVVVVDGSDNVIMAGSFIGTVDFGGGGLPSVFNHDVVLAKYDPSGTHLWSQRFGDQFSTGGTAIPFSLALDASDAVVVTGYFSDSIDFGGGLLSSGGSTNDIFLAKYDASGAHLWSTDFGTHPSMDEGCAVALDPWSNIVLTGSFSGQVDFGGGGILTQGGDDIFVARLGAGPSTGVGDTPRSNTIGLTAFPNPFNPETTVQFTIPRSGRVILSIHDARGARVALLVDSEVPAGTHEVRWNGRGDHGNPIASGVYLATISFGSTKRSHKIVLAK